MWSSGTKTVCSSFLVLLYIALLTYSCDGKTDTQLCSEEFIASDELTFICSCQSINEGFPEASSSATISSRDRMDSSRERSSSTRLYSNNTTLPKIIIIQDNKITYGNIQITVPNTTKHWRIGECSAVHLSGPTLTSLKNIHTLQLHHIDQIHIAYDFLLQYKTQLQNLQVSHSKFAALEGSLNIHAHKLKNIVLDNLIWKGQFNLVILTQEDQNLDLIAIKNSTIEVLGEINISSKYVHKFVLEYNDIGTILTGAIFHNSNETNILGNYIDQLNFLSLDTDTCIFTLQGNTIKFLSLETLVVNNATLIQVINNSFFHIDRYALTWLRLRSEKGLMVFSSNHFHKHIKGSLIFYLATYNEKLVIKNNILHTTICNCSSAKLIETMTEANENVIPSFKMEKDKTNKLFIESSFCLDEERKLSKISKLCASNESYWSWELPVIVIVIIVTCGLLVNIVLKQFKYKLKYERLLTDTERDIFSKKSDLSSERGSNDT